MLNLSNILSFSRAGLALAFLSDSIIFRLAAIICAMITDSLDGFIARRRGVASQFGAVLDPIMDKFFVFFAAGILFRQDRLLSWQLTTLFSRDIAICFFGVYLLWSRGWKDYECRSLLWGKVATILQFFILIFLTVNFKVHNIVYYIFILIGIGTFIELTSLFKKVSKLSHRGS